MEAAELADSLVLWIRERVLAAGCRGVVTGLSGGIDSSVLAVLCHRAFPENMLGIRMPCYSNPEDGKHVMAIVEKFAIPVKKVTLDGVFDNLLETLPNEDTEPGVIRLAQANLKARLRMVALYYYANRLRYMVIGSGNRSELTVGYFTKYGDGGVDLLPLGNLVKAQIKKLARSLGIPQPIIDKPPSAGLWPGQTDEAEMGLTYKALDRYLTTGQASPEIKARIEAMKSVNQHKLSPPPRASFDNA